MAQNCNVSTKRLTEFTSLVNVPKSFPDFAKKHENFEFLHGVNIEFIVSLKINGTKYFLIFDDSCNEI